MDADKPKREPSILTPTTIDDRVRCPICRDKWRERDMRWQLNGRAVYLVCADRLAQALLKPEQPKDDKPS